MKIKQHVTLFLALLLLLQCAVPAFAVQTEELTEAEVSVSEEDLTESAEESESMEDPDTLEELELTEEPAASEEYAAEPETEHEAEPVTEAPDEPEPAADEAQTETEPEAEPETLTEEVTEEITEEVTGELLFNGLEADYDDPEFLLLLEQGFFDETEDEPQRAEVQHASAFRGYEITRGVDVSKWNNVINFNKAKRDGISFAIIRCGNRFSNGGGLAKDVMFDRNMKAAKAAGLEVGVYFFSQAITEKEAIAEANYTLKLVKGYSFNLPIVFDYEYYQNGRLTRANLSKTQRTKICKAFCKTIEDAGYSAMVYANRDMLTKDMYGQELPKAGYEVWLAEWNNSPKYTGTYTYWQYSDNGHVNGFDHQVDVNYRYRLPDATISKLTNTASGVKLSWNKVAPADGYRIYRKSGSGAWKLLKTLTSNSTLSYVDTTAVSGKKYSYTVQTYDGLIDGTFHNTGSAITCVKALAPGETLAAPKLLAATGSAAGINVQWKSVSKAAYYRVYRKTEGSKWALVASVSDGTSWLDKTAEAGTVYTYTVRAVNGIVSPYQKEGIQGKILPTPRILYASSRNSGKQVVVAWNAVSGASKYKVFRRIGTTGGWTSLGVVTGTTFVDKNVKQGTAYRYTVRPYGTFNGKSTNGGYNKTGVAVVWLDMPVLNAAKISGSRIKVSWKAAKGAAQYLVYRKIGTGSWKLLKTVTSLSCIDTIPKVGTKVYYTVRSQSGSTRSGFDQNGVTGLVLATPNVKKPTRVSGGVRVAWNKVNGATQYRVYRKTAKTAWTTLGYTTSASFVDSFAETGKSYTYTVRACATVQNQSLISGFTPSEPLFVLDTPVVTEAEWTEDGVRITISAVDGAKDYWVYRKSEGGTWTKVGTTDGNTIWVDPIENNGQNVLYTVRAVRGDDLSLYDSVGFVLAPPEVPPDPSEDPSENPSEEPSEEPSENPSEEPTEPITEPQEQPPQET